MDERRDDWRKGVDERLVSLTSAQRSSDTEIEDLGVQVADAARLLHGDEGEDKAGLVERIHELERLVNLLRGTVLPDYTGKGGFAWRLDALEQRREERVSSARDKWKLAGVVIFAIVLLIREVVHDLPDLKAYFHKPIATNVEQDIEDAFQPPKSKHHKRKAKVKSPPRVREAVDESHDDLPSLLDANDSDPR